MADTWRQLFFDLSTVAKVKIACFLGTSKYKPCVLYGFCDASERGYAAVVYIALETADGSLHITLLGAKTKLLQLKATTIP